MNLFNDEIKFYLHENNVDLWRENFPSGFGYDI